MADKAAPQVPEEIGLNRVEEARSSSTAGPDIVSQKHGDDCDTASNTTSSHCDATSASACCEPSHLSTPHSEPCTSRCDSSSGLTSSQHDSQSCCNLGDAVSCDSDHLIAEGSTSGGTVTGGPKRKDEGGRGGEKELQKADSGIEVEKSPSVSMREGLSDGDGGDSVSEYCLDSTGLSHSESFRSDDSHGQPGEEMDEYSFILDGDAGMNSSVLESKVGIVASSLDHNAGLDASISNCSVGVDIHDSTSGANSSILDCTSLTGNAPSTENQGKEIQDILRIEDSLSDARVTEEARQIISSDDGDEGEASVETETALREENQNLIISVCGEDGDEEAMTETDQNVTRNKHEDEDDEAEVNNNPWPQHKWRVVPDLRAREIGVTGCTPPSLFREKVQGSLYMVERLKLQYRMEHHEGCVNSLHFNRIGTLLASGADDLQIVLWNWARNRKALVYDSGHRSNVFQAKFMPYSGDCHVVSCARDGQVRLSELSLTGVCKSTKKLAQHKGAAHKLALEYDSPHVFLSCGEDALTFQIDLREEKPHKLIVTKENDSKVPLYSIHSNPVNPYQFLTSGRDPYVRIYDKRKINENVNTGILKKYCPKHLDNGSQKTNVTCACYSYNGSEIVGSYNDEDIYVFDNLTSDSTDAVHRYVGHRNNATVKGVSFYGPRSEYVVTGSDCGHVYIWDKETEHIVQFLEADRGGVVNVLEPHPFAPVLATSGLDHDVKIWAPISHDPPRLEGLEMQKRKNRRDRRVENENAQEPEMIDGQMLWFIMNHFRRSARRRLREGGEDVSSSSNSSDSDDDDDNDNDDDDDHEGAADRMQCQTS